MGLDQAECRQNPDVASHGRPVSLKHMSQFRNRRRIPSHRIENANTLRSQYANQIGGIFKRQAHLRKQPFTRSSLCARTADLPKKASVVPVPTRLRLLIVFFIFLPPEFAHVVLKPFRQRLVVGELNSFDTPYEMPVMATMPVVVAECSPIVHPADQIINVGEVVSRHFAIYRRWVI
jgi:hypothetical protein